MKNKRLMLYSIITISTIIGMDAGAASAAKGTDVVRALRTGLDKQCLPRYQAHFDSFVETRRWQAKAIAGWVGGALAQIFAGVDIDEARAFLGRTFENETALKQAAQDIHTDDDSIAYLHTLLSNMNQDHIRKKNSKPLAALMKQHKHPALTQIDAKPWEKDKIDDKTFYRIAACNFMAYVMVEEGAPTLEISDDTSH